MIKKELRIRRTGPYTFGVYFEDGGQVPKELEGDYTKQRSAAIAIDAYLKKRDGVKAENGDKNKHRADPIKQRADNGLQPA